MTRNDWDPSGFETWLREQSKAKDGTADDSDASGEEGSGEKHPPLRTVDQNEGDPPAKSKSNSSSSGFESLRKMKAEREAAGAANGKVGWIQVASPLFLTAILLLGVGWFVWQNGQSGSQLLDSNADSVDRVVANQPSKPKPPETRTPTSTQLHAQLDQLGNAVAAAFESKAWQHDRNARKAMVDDLRQMESIAIKMGRLDDVQVIRKTRQLVERTP